MKILITALLVSLLTACGAYEERAVGLEEDTLLVLRGESLVGTTVNLSSGFSRVIGESDLTEYTMGIGGVTDREEQNLETITLKVESGLQRLTITRNGSTVLDRELQFTRGQTRELRIR